MYTCPSTNTRPRWCILAMNGSRFTLKQLSCSIDIYIFHGSFHPQLSNHFRYYLYCVYFRKSNKTNTNIYIEPERKKHTHTHKEREREKANEIISIYLSDAILRFPHYMYAFCLIFHFNLNWYLFAYFVCSISLFVFLLKVERTFPFLENFNRIISRRRRRHRCRRSRRLRRHIRFYSEFLCAFIISNFSVHRNKF